MSVDFTKIHNKLALLAITFLVTFIGLNVLCPKPIESVSAANYAEIGRAHV